MGVESNGLKGLDKLFTDLGRWTNSGAREDVDKGAKDMALDFQEKILRGQGADGSPLALLKKATLQGPIRRDRDPQIRQTSYGDVPLHATGKTARSISAKKKGFDEWEVSSDTDRGDMILYSNAKQTHSGEPFAGDTSKSNRDPLQVTDKQIDILEHHLLNGIDKALNG